MIIVLKEVYDFTKFSIELKIGTEARKMQIYDWEVKTLEDFNRAIEEIHNKLLHILKDSIAER